MHTSQHEQKRVLDVLKALVALALIGGGVYYLADEGRRNQLNEWLKELDAVSPENFPKYGDPSEYPAKLPPAKVLPLPANGMEHIVYSGEGRDAAADHQ